MFDNAHFPHAEKFWHMGRFQEWSTAHVHGMSHALHYGTSVFEGIRAYMTPDGPAVFRLDDHIDRFFHSASILHMIPPFNKQTVIEAVKALLRKNSLDAAYIRPLMYYAYGNLGLVPKASPVEMLIAAWEWGAYLGERAQEGVHVYLLPWRRIHHSQLDMTAKLGGVYVQSTICGLLARSKGCDEAVFLNMEGNVAEGPGENIVIVKDGVLRTNDRSESILEGITRTSLLTIAADQGWKTEIGPITKKDFLEADEAFFCGTAVEVAPIARVTDGSDPGSPERTSVIGTGRAGELTMKLRKLYMETVGGKRAEYKKWLTSVKD
jgi:branched-chain amino acid aminotransferase